MSTIRAVLICQTEIVTAKILLIYTESTVVMEMGGSDGGGGNGMFSGWIVWVPVKMVVQTHQQHTWKSTFWFKNCCGCYCCYFDGQNKIQHLFRIIRHLWRGFLKIESLGSQQSEYSIAQSNTTIDGTTAAAVFVVAATANNKEYKTIIFNNDSEIKT